MLAPFFHAWERRLASISKDRIVRPFDWGIDWTRRTATTATVVPSSKRGWTSPARQPAFFTAPPTSDFEFAAASAD